MTLHQKLQRFRLACCLFALLCVTLLSLWFLQRQSIAPIHMTGYVGAAALEGLGMAVAGIPFSYVIEFVIKLVRER
jgi:hypothetical protein